MEEQQMKTKYMILLGVIALFFIFFFSSQTGLFSVAEYNCSQGSSPPCDKAVWVEDKCSWDMTKCTDYCAADPDCHINVPKPNDCSMFYNPTPVSQVGYCKFNLCQWQDVPTAERTCTAFELGLQKWKWMLVGLLVTIIILAYSLFEVDFKGKKRGFI
jgi:hypothetical protein